MTPPFRYQVPPTNFLNMFLFIETLLLTPSFLTKDYARNIPRELANDFPNCPSPSHFLPSSTKRSIGTEPFLTSLRDALFRSHRWVHDAEIVCRK
ncbi:hypothetical protein CDAR_270171 [Caerostris darwini]|uniref:Uncharacterized protein n=1 Tax=Caerostris darwini TaxID=1538125 RepID=A0AAV4UME4_9ARAC|nr:hypothetical protein CDAR_270171 [Caerostris darwini]